MSLRRRTPSPRPSSTARRLSGIAKTNCASHAFVGAFRRSLFGLVTRGPVLSRWPRATDDDLIEAFVLGRRPQDRALLLKSAALLATFGLVYREPLTAGHLRDIAGLGHGLEESDLRSAVDDLRRRGVAQSRGRAVLLQPRPIAMRLAERQWEEWSHAEWDHVLAGDTSPGLRTSAARQLALLNTTETARRVVDHVCRPGGPFDGFTELSKTGNAEVLSGLAEIDPAIVAETIRDVARRG